MNGRRVGLIFEKGFFHDEIFGGYVFLPFAIEEEFNLAASEDIVVLSGACVINFNVNGYAWNGYGPF